MDEKDEVCDTSSSCHCSRCRSIHASSFRSVKIAHVPALPIPLHHWLLLSGVWIAAGHASSIAWADRECVQNEPFTGCFNPNHRSVQIAAWMDIQTVGPKDRVCRHLCLLDHKKHPGLAFPLASTPLIRVEGERGGSCSE